MNSFKEISPFSLTENPFKLIGKDWLLVTAEHNQQCNMMTASWGGMGILWNKPVAFTFIRPQRYTFGMLENSEYCSLCVLDESYRNVLTFCGTKSGRDVDKIKATSLTLEHIDGVPYFAEAKTVMIVKKLYAQNMNADSVTDTATVSKNYCPDGSDWHKMYINEIVKVLVKE